MQSKLSSKLGLVLAVLLVLPGAACVSTTSSYVKTDLPPVPKGLRECFVGVSALPAQAEWDGKVVAQALTKVRTSELNKTDCGKRLLAFYDSLYSGL